MGKKSPETVAEAVPMTETVSTVEPTLQGTYAVFRTPKGGIHLVYRPLGAEEDCHLDIPPMIVNMAEKAAAGGDVGGGMMAKMMRMGR